MFIIEVDEASFNTADKTAGALTDVPGEPVGTEEEHTSVWRQYGTVLRTDERLEQNPTSFRG